MANKRVVTPPRVGVRPPPPLRGSSPCEAGQSYHFRPIYNKVSSPSYVRILENPHFFEKKVPESLPESKKKAYLCTRNQENNLLRKEKEIIERFT